MSDYRDGLRDGAPTHAQLKALEQAIRADERAKAAAEEGARIVAWLRGGAKLPFPDTETSPDAVYFALAFADAIEAGAHETTTTKEGTER